MNLLIFYLKENILFAPNYFTINLMWLNVFQYSLTSFCEGRQTAYRYEPYRGKESQILLSSE